MREEKRRRRVNETNRIKSNKEGGSQINTKINNKQINPWDKNNIKIISKYQLP